MLGQVRRAQAEAERAAAVSLRSVTDNPVYVLPDGDRPLGAVISTGGYHNARAPAAMDGVGSVWADLCQLAQRLTDKLLQHPATAALLARDEWTMKPLHMVADRVGGGGARARRPDAALARRLRPERRALDGLPRLAPRRRRSAAAWTRRSRSSPRSARRRSTPRARPPPPALAPLVDEVRAVFPPVDGVRPLGPDGDALAGAFAHAACSAGPVAAADVARS